MAQLGVAGAGAVVGGAIGFFAGNPVLGAQLGWAVGGVAGALLFPNKGPDQVGPRLNDLSVQTSGYGVPIAAVAGQAKLAGNIIWKKDIREQKTTRRQGKGGGPRVTSYSYFGSWAVGLCEWLAPAPDPGVLRIWLDNKLVYDATGLSDTVAIPGLVWRFYPGDDAQFPDPLIEATVGATEAPAHRGLAYIVFDDVPLDRFGNRVPNVTVELVGQITRSFPQVASIPPAAPLFASSPSNRSYTGWPTNVAIDYARGRIYEGRTRTAGYSTPADELIRVYDLVTMQTLGEYPLSTVLAPVFPLGLAPAASNTSAGLMHLGVDGFLYITGGTSNRVPLFKIDPDAMLAVGVWGDLPGPGFGFGGDDLRLIQPMQIVSISVPRLNTTPRTFVVVQGAYSATQVIDADAMTYVWGANGVAIEPPIVPINLGIGPLTYPVLLVPGRTRDDGGVEFWYLRGSEFSAPYRIDVTRFRIYSGAANLGGGAAMGIFRDDYTAIDVPVEVDALADYVLLQAAYWDVADDTLVITFAGDEGGVGNYSRFSTIKWAPGAGVVWAVVNHALPGAHDARGQMSRVLGGTWGLGGNLLLQTGSGDALVNGAGASFKSLYWLDEQQAVVGFNAAGGGTREIAKRYLSRVAPNALTVGVVVEALCLRAGLQVSDVNVAALTDSLRGYMLARPMSARDAITPLAAYAQADAVEQDDVILFRKRAGSTVAAIAYDDLVRENPDAGVIEEQRAQDADLPREVTVRYADIERGWEQGAQSWRRPASPTATMQSRGVSAIDLPMPLTATEAKTVARRFCIATWRERTRLTFSVGPRHARLVPTDAITVGLRDGATIRCRILSTQLGANWVTRVEAVTEDAATYALSATGDAGSDWDEPQMPLPYSTRLVVPDLALIEDGEDLGQRGLREYAFACAYGGQRFRGVTVIERGPGAPWDQLGVVTTPVEWGSLIATPTVPGTPWTWDETGSLRVRMTTGEPESATDLEVLNGANRAALVAADGSAEIVQWRTATQQADGTWTLTGLLRGRRGTEDRIASRRAGDLFLILDGTRLLYDAATGDATAVRQLKAVSIFDTPDTAPGLVVKARRGRAEQPYAVAAPAGTRDGSNNLTLTWVRRTRVGGELLDGMGVVPLSEAAEAYDVVIFAGAGAALAPAPDASSFFFGNPAFGAAQAFKGTVTGNPFILDAATGWLRVSYAGALTIARYRITPRDDGFTSQAPRDWTFQGWDGTGWVTLDTRASETGWTAGVARAYDIPVASRGPYTQYRLNISANNGDTYTAVEGLEFFGGTVAGTDLARLSETVVRTIAVTAPTAAYSAANQVTDFGASGGVFRVGIYQISGVVGRGILSEVIV
jgi:hypothetical protein